MSTVSARTAGGIIRVTATGQGSLTLDFEQALDLVGELAAEVLEMATAAQLDHQMGAALGDLLEAMSQAIVRRHPAVQS
jgi:hypothetical protein